MQSFPLRKYPTRDVSITDTTSPYIPIYFIHSFEQPFCDIPTCLCFAQRQKKQKLFIALVEGKLELEKASNLMNKESEGSNA